MDINRLSQADLLCSVIRESGAQNRHRQKKTRSLTTDTCIYNQNSLWFLWFLCSNHGLTMVPHGDYKHYISNHYPHLSTKILFSCGLATMSIISSIMICL